MLYFALQFLQISNYYQFSFWARSKLRLKKLLIILRNRLIIFFILDILFTHQIMEKKSFCRLKITGNLHAIVQTFLPVLMAMLLQGIPFVNHWRMLHMEGYLGQYIFLTSKIHLIQHWYFQVQTLSVFGKSPIIFVASVKPSTDQYS